ncbi:hypothetical protein SC171_21725 [Pantoea cypripedii]|uniref:hypothetical protein n=1 Tax=Pantoea cypripedii TaxID=55209 RepID=UPI002FC60A4A
MARYLPLEKKTENTMEPRKLTGLTVMNGPVIKSRFAPRPSIDDALGQLRRYVSGQLRSIEKDAEIRYQNAFEQGVNDGFQNVLGQIPDVVAQQQQLMEVWLDWIRKELELRLPEYLMTSVSLDSFIRTLTREFSITDVTLWLPRKVIEEAGHIERRCKALGITSFALKTHDENCMFRLEAGPMVWVFDAKKQVIQQVVWQLGKPDMIAQCGETNF